MEETRGDLNASDAVFLPLGKPGDDTGLDRLGEGVQQSHGVHNSALTL